MHFNKKYFCERRFRPLIHIMCISSCSKKIAFIVIMMTLTRRLR